MRRAYVESRIPLDEAINIALDWAGETASIHAPDTASIDADDTQLLAYDVPVTCASRRSRLFGRPQGTVAAVFLNGTAVLELEQASGVDGIVVVDAHGRQRYTPDSISHAPWITAFGAEHLGGNHIPAVPEAPAPIKAAMKGLTRIAVLNQGLLDKRERSEVIDALAFLQARGIEIDPDAVLVEALRNRWGKSGPEQAHAIAVDLRGGHKLKYQKGRLTQRVLEEWANAT